MRFAFTFLEAWDNSLHTDTSRRSGLFIPGENHPSWSIRGTQSKDYASFVGWGQAHFRPKLGGKLMWLNHKRQPRHCSLIVHPKRPHKPRLGSVAMCLPASEMANSASSWTQAYNQQTFKVQTPVDCVGIFWQPSKVSASSLRKKSDLLLQLSISSEEIYLCIKN